MDPDNQLYDAACELLAAAQRLTRASHRRGVEPAVPATIGCIESALDALAVACAGLQSDVTGVQRDAFAELVSALRRAAQASAAARSSSAGLIA
ncbi:MAG: hypothetical protein QOF29_3458 [bacterium]|jgi:hypothetical protein|nr:hypothetical protein [Solirubrobacteraceae bacterium]